jgi:hypothetical protein
MRNLITATCAIVAALFLGYALLCPDGESQPRATQEVVADPAGLAWDSKGARTGYSHVTLPPQHSEADTLWRSLACRAYGVIVVSQLRVGMTTQEADRLIGTLPVEAGQFFTQKYHCIFKQFGFSVSEAPDSDGQWRITHVELLPWP